MSTKYIISGDSHIIEPFDLWTNVLADKHGDKLPQVVEGYKDLPGQYFFTGIEYLKVDLLEPADAAESSGELKGLGDELEAKVKLCNTDPAIRVELMDYDGIVAEVINSTFMLLNMRMEDVTVLQDVCQVYNDWIAEYCSHDPKRLLGAAMIDMHDPQWATAELNRIAKKGLRTAIPQNALRPQSNPTATPATTVFGVLRRISTCRSRFTRSPVRSATPSPTTPPTRSILRRPN